MANVKKIIYLVTQSEPGGAQRYILDLAKNLKNEHEIKVIFGEPGEAGEWPQNLKKAGIAYYYLPRLKRSVSPLNDYRALIEITRLLKKIQPDILHLNSSKASILGSLGAWLYKKTSGRPIRVVYTAHGWVFNEPLSFFKKGFYLWAEKSTARFKDKIICVSEFDRQAGLKEKIAPADKLVTIHNGLDAPEFISKSEARKTLNLPANSLIIGSIGHLYKTKGYEYFIEAASLLKKKRPASYVFAIIGDGQERKNLLALIKKHGLSNDFFLPGSVPDAAKYLKALDVYVCSSVKEGLPYTILEALQAELPIVATRVGGIPEIINDGQNGFLVDPKNPGQIAERIKNLCRGSALQEKKTGGALLSAAQMAEMTKKVYLEL